MTTILTIALPDLRRLAGIDAADTSQDAALQAVQAAEQAVIEYGLDPDQLAATATDAGLNATLALGAAEILAGRYLQQQARAPGVLDDFKIGPLTLTAAKAPGLVALAQGLAQHGAARLSPYGKAPSAVSGGIASAQRGKTVSAGPSDLLAAPPVSTGLAGTSTASGLFGSLQADATGTDDSEPPGEFASGFVSFTDPEELP